MLVLHIYGYRASLLLFYDNQDLNLSNVNMNEHIPTYIYPGNTENNLWDNAIHTLHDGRKVLWLFFIFMRLEPFYYYYIITKTLKLNNVK